MDIRLESDDKHIRLTISDNGNGVEQDRKTETLGLIGMKERVISLGGNLLIKSTPGSGTRIEVAVPLTTTQNA